MGYNKRKTSQEKTDTVFEGTLQKGCLTTKKEDRCLNYKKRESA